MAAVVAAALLAAGPALAAGIAYAAPSKQVEFSGGSVLNMVVCKSQPSVSTLTVPAETSVSFANRLSQTASLLINGSQVATVGANQEVPVRFHFGPVSVSMSVPCNVGVVKQFGSVVVNVTKPSTTTATSSSGGSTTAVQGVATQGAGRASAADRAAAAAAGRPAGAKSPAAAVSPSASAAEDATIWGQGGLLDQSQPPLAKDLNAGTNPALADGAAPADVGAVVPASGTPRRTPSGLLALIAAVLTIGVGVAGIRSLMAGRATRARFA